MLRLTAPDGYRAQRSYSIATAPSPADGEEDQRSEVELTIELLPGGEVSSFLHEVVEPGDELEVRGPIGGYFVWAGEGPATLVGGGSGVVPLASMLRLARRLGREDLVRLVVSARRPSDLYYADELVGPEVRTVYTREAPPDHSRPVGRITADDLAPALHPRRRRLRVRHDRVRRRRQRPAHGPRRAGRAHPRRALRPHRLSRGAARRPAP